MVHDPGNEKRHVGGQIDSLGPDFFRIQELHGKIHAARPDMVFRDQSGFAAEFRPHQLFGVPPAFELHVLSAVRWDDRPLFRCGKTAFFILFDPADPQFLRSAGKIAHGNRDHIGGDSRRIGHQTAAAEDPFSEGVGPLEIRTVIFCPGGKFLTAGLDVAAETDPPFFPVRRRGFPAHGGKRDPGRHDPVVFLDFDFRAELGNIPFPAVERPFLVGPLFDLAQGPAGRRGQQMELFFFAGRQEQQFQIVAVVLLYRFHELFAAHTHLMAVRPYVECGVIIVNLHGGGMRGLDAASRNRKFIQGHGIVKTFSEGDGRHSVQKRIRSGAFFHLHVRIVSRSGLLAAESDTDFGILCIRRSGERVDLKFFPIGISAGPDPLMIPRLLLFPVLVDPFPDDLAPAFVQPDDLHAGLCFPRHVFRFHHAADIIALPGGHRESGLIQENTSRHFIGISIIAFRLLRRADSAAFGKFFDPAIDRPRMRQPAVRNSGRLAFGLQKLTVADQIFLSVLRLKHPGGNENCGRSQ